MAKDIGDSVGLMAGILCDWLPPWALILLGAVQNIVGYGWLWLIVTHRVPPLHFTLVLPSTFMCTDVFTREVIFKKH